MALQGTLKDFGIAEILQLIGQQAKSGVLHLKSRDQAIHILISDGTVVSAEHAGRKARERLGTMLVRSGLLSEADLRRALEAQTRTLRRLGDILVEMDLVTTDDLRQMTGLQTTETVYKLFHWKSGTYQFEPGAAEFDPTTVTPLRAETLLMEGFRQVDEWPMVRRKISSPHMTFERVGEIEGERERTQTVTKSLGPGDEAESAFAGLRERSGEHALGAAERRVFGLADPGRTVERIVDLSRLGEFETCKALLTLVNIGHLRAVPPARRSVAEEYARNWRDRVRRGAAGLLATLAIGALLALIAWAIGERGVAPPPGLRDNTARRFLARYQIGRLRGALEVYRLERGDYPDRLADLVDAGLADGRDLAYPWASVYDYRRTDAGYLLLPPLE
ncbi:MAG TPA: DUF4388 domain-containing protein [Anaeromyxobacteraceae bacterium]